MLKVKTQHRKQGNREHVLYVPDRYSGNKCFFSSDSTFICNSHYLFWTRATTVSCTRQTIFQIESFLDINIKHNNRSFYSFQNYSLPPDPSLLRFSPWSIPYSLIHQLIHCSFDCSACNIHRSFFCSPWSIACFLSFDFSSFYINRSFYCSPIHTSLASWSITPSIAPYPSLESWNNNNILYLS